MNKVIIKNGKYVGKKAIIIDRSKTTVALQLIGEKAETIFLSEEDIEPI